MSVRRRGRGAGEWPRLHASPRPVRRGGVQGADAFLAAAFRRRRSPRGCHTEMHANTAPAHARRPSSRERPPPRRPTRTSPQRRPRRPARSSNSPRRVGGGGGEPLTPLRAYKHTTVQSHSQAPCLAEYGPYMRTPFPRATVPRHAPTQTEPAGVRPHPPASKSKNREPLRPPQRLGAQPEPRAAARGRT